jgi:hypothetical protein
MYEDIDILDGGQVTQDLRQLGTPEFTGSTRAVRIRRQPDPVSLAHDISSSCEGRQSFALPAPPANTTAR